jgi:O-antigen/teichoic acid export membrane protein
VVGAYLIGFPGVLLTTLLASLLGCVAYSRELGYIAPRWSGTFTREIGALLRNSLPLFALVLILMGLHTVDSVMTLKLLGTEALGMYTLAVSGGNVVYGLANSTGVVVYPRMQESYGRERDVGVLIRYVEAPTQLLAIGLPLISGVLFFAIPVIITAFVPKFIPGIPSFQVLVVGVAFYGLEGMPKLCLLSLGKTRHLMLWAVLTTATCIGAMMLMPRGLWGVALGATLGHLMAFIGMSTHVMAAVVGARRTLAFLVGAIVPIIYGAILLAVIESAWPVARQHSFIGGTAIASAKLAAFLLGYVPLLVLTEPRTHLLHNHGLRLVRGLRARFTRRRPSG